MFFKFLNKLEALKINYISYLYSVAHRAVAGVAFKKYYDENEKIGITNSIKLALTKHHGLSIRKNSKKDFISYKDFRRNYKKYKDYEIRYYITERSIRNKIKMMKSFIDKCNYKYLFLS